MTTIKTIVVLSAPSTASSLIAECLNTKIYMGKGFNDGHYENSDMRQLSSDILAHAKKIDTEPPLFSDYTARLTYDPWDNPPSEQAILDSADTFKKRIINTIRAQENHATHSDPKPVREISGNSAKFWGWKDGRIGWVIPIIAPYLNNPHYIVLQRDLKSTAQALARRMDRSEHSLGVDRVTILIKTMYQRIFKFMASQYDDACSKT